MQNVRLPKTFPMYQLFADKNSSSFFHVCQFKKCTDVSSVPILQKMQWESQTRNKLFDKNGQI